MQCDHQSSSSSYMFLLCCHY